MSPDSIALQFKKKKKLFLVLG